MRKNKGRGFRGQLKLDISKMERHRTKLERRVQKMVQEIVLLNNLIEAMTIARTADAATPAQEAASTATQTQEVNAELEKVLVEANQKIEELTVPVEDKKDEPNATAQG